MGCRIIFSLLKSNREFSLFKQCVVLFGIRTTRLCNSQCNIRIMIPVLDINCQFRTDLLRLVLGKASAGWKSVLQREDRDSPEK